MKILSLWQPWATLLVYGIKRLETRPSETRWTQEKGSYLIHAAQKWTKAQRELCLQEPFRSELIKLRYLVDFINEETGETVWIPMLPLGQIIGSIEVTNCNPIYQQENGKVYYFDIFNHKVGKKYIIEPEKSFGDYREGRYVWECENPRVLNTPIPHKGQQGYYQDYKGDESLLKFKP